MGARSLLEEAIVSESTAKSILSEIDKVVESIDPGKLDKSAEAFDALTKSVEDKIAKAISGCKALGTDAKLKEACTDLWGGAQGASLQSALQRLLCGSFMSVFKGAAFCRKQLKQ